MTFIGRKNLALGIAYIMISAALIGGIAAWQNSPHKLVPPRQDIVPVDNTTTGTLSPEARQRWMSQSALPDYSVYGRITNLSLLLNTSGSMTLQHVAALEGKENFTNAGNNYYRGGNGSLDYSLAGMNEKDVASPGGTGQPVRTVEEADIVKVIGDMMYILNPYRGLIVVNISNPDNPVIAGNARILGSPVEMYVVDFLAFIIVNTDYGYWHRYAGINGMSDGTAGEIGSRIIVVNCANPANPIVVKSFSLDGFASNSRRVGDVIYAVTNTYSWWGYTYSMTSEDSTRVTSISFSDPSTVGVIQNVSFPGSSNEIHASSTALFVAQYNYTSGTTSTKVTYVDISDPYGSIETRGSVLVPGTILTRFMMDHWNGYFRIVTHAWSGIGSSTLRVYDVTNPDAFVQVGILNINDAGSLMATRFAGSRAYTIHLPRSVDPLDVIDLSDPAHPELCDVFEMPGWVTYMEVKGYKIVALGVDDSSGSRRVAVSIFDVTDPHNVVMTSRVQVGNGSSWSGATWDDKMLSIIDGAGLVLVPYSAYRVENGRSRYTNGVQLVSFNLTTNTLALGGSVDSDDYIQRTRLANGRIFATSNERLTVINGLDRDHPAVTAEIELAFNLVDAWSVPGYIIELVSDWDRECYLRISPQSDADLSITSLQLGVDYGSGILNGHFLYFLGSFYDSARRDQRYTLKVIDLSNPTSPSIVGTYQFEQDYSPYLSGWYALTSDYARMISPTTMMLLLYHYNYTYISSPYYYSYNSSYFVAAMDLSNPAHPAMISKVNVSSDYPQSFFVRGPKAFFSTSESFYYTDSSNNSRWGNRYFLTTADFSDPSLPVVAPKINVPGEVKDISANGAMLYTAATWYNETYWTYSTFNIVALEGGRATILSALAFEQSVKSVRVQNGRAYIEFGYNYWWGMYMYEDSMKGDSYSPYYSSASNLVVLDVSNPSSPALEENIALPEGANYMRADGNYLFFSMWGNGLLVYDISQPDVGLLGLYSLPGYWSNVKMTPIGIFAISGYYGLTIISPQTGQLF